MVCFFFLILLFCYHILCMYVAGHVRNLRQHASAVASLSFATCQDAPACEASKGMLVQTLPPHFQAVCARENPVQVERERVKPGQLFDPELNLVVPFAMGVLLGGTKKGGGGRTRIHIRDQLGPCHCKT